MNSLKKILFYIWESIIKTVLSPTYAFAKIRKNKKKKRAKFIKNSNTAYLIISICLVLILLCFLEIKEKSFWVEGTLLLLIFYYCFSRINEVFFAFYRDAIDKMAKIKSKSKSEILTYSDRVRLALRSYIELILDYAIVYYIFNSYILKNNLMGFEGYQCKLNNLLDLIYYSGVTITTLGYGDFSPEHIFLKFFSVYEVINGTLLLVVCFTIYVSLSFNEGINFENKKGNNQYLDHTKSYLIIVFIFYFMFSLYLSSSV